MADIFVEKDPLLSSMGTVVLYYFLVKFKGHEKWFAKLTRGTLIKFEDLRAANRKLAEETGDADFKLLEYDRMVTGPNDSSYMRYRFEVLLEFLQRELCK